MGWGTKVSIQLVYVTIPRWPPCPYMVKTFKTLLLWNRKADNHEIWYAAAASTRVLIRLLKRCPGLTLTYFTAMSNLVPML